MNKSEHNEERINHIIQMLNEMDVDGETMEYIINQVGMEQQMLKQLVMKMPIEWTIRLLFEKVNLPQ
jgi:Trm5-related predicted tRNA methylase